MMVATGRCIAHARDEGAAAWQRRSGAACGSAACVWRCGGMAVRRRGGAAAWRCGGVAVAAGTLYQCCCSTGSFVDISSSGVMILQPRPYLHCGIVFDAVGALGATGAALGAGAGAGAGAVVVAVAIAGAAAGSESTGGTAPGGKSSTRAVSALKRSVANVSMATTLPSTSTRESRAAVKGSSSGFFLL